MLRVKSVASPMGVGDPLCGDRLFILPFTEEGIETVGSTIVSRINCVDDFISEEVWRAMTSFPRGISTQVVECRSGEIAFSGTDRTFVREV